jgi:hypothetical protein
LNDALRGQPVVIFVGWVDTFVVTIFVIFITAIPSPFPSFLAKAVFARILPGGGGGEIRPADCVTFKVMS